MGPSHLSALRPLQDPRTTDLQLRRTNSQPLVPKGRCWISTRKVYVDQVVLLMQNINDSFETKKKAGAVLPI